MIQLKPAVETAEDLLARFERTGDSAPFAEIVRRYSGMVYGVCYRVTRNAHDAEDATQAVFLKLATQARTTNGIPRVGPWLQQVAKTTAVDLRRSRTRRHNREQIRAAIVEQQQDFDDATDSAAVDEIKQLLREEVDNLPVHYRTPLILYYFGGLSTEQIAVELKTNAKALAVRLFRGRKMLGSRLEKKGIRTAGGALLTLAVADAMLSVLSGSLFSAGGSAGVATIAGAGGTTTLTASSAGMAGWSGSSAFATSHSAVLATLAERVVSVARACAVATVASKWKLSFALLLTVGSAMAGSAESVRVLEPVKKAGELIDDIGEKLRNLNRLSPQLRQSGPALRAEARPDAVALPNNTLAAAPAGPLDLGGAPPINALAPATGGLYTSGGIRSIGFGGGFGTAGLGSSASSVSSKPGPSATQALLAFANSSAPVAAGSRGSVRPANARSIAATPGQGQAQASATGGAAAGGPSSDVIGATFAFNSRFGPSPAGGSTLRITGGESAPYPLDYPGVAMADGGDAAPGDAARGGAAGTGLVDEGNLGVTLVDGTGPADGVVDGAGGLEGYNPEPPAPSFVDPLPGVIGGGATPTTNPVGGIPEPAGLTLLGAAAVGLLARRRRK